MQLAHKPLFVGDDIVKFYKNKYNLDVKYICTTELLVPDLAYDIFYKDSKDSMFNCNYFGLRLKDGVAVLKDADFIESFIFEMIVDENDFLHYSRTKTDSIVFEKEKGTCSVSGGRFDSNSSGEVYLFTLKDGDFFSSERTKH